MDCHHYTTELPERKRGQHLQREERGAIQALKQQGLSNRAIASALGCSPTTIGNELQRGTPPRKSNRGRAPGYSAKLGEAVYRSNRIRSRKSHKLPSCWTFVSWMTTQVRERKWSLDACVGYAKRHGLFPSSEMVCTRTLYHEAWAGNLPIGIMELPEAVKRRHTQTSKPRENKKNYGKSIDLRPEIASQRTEEGHWEGDLKCHKPTKDIYDGGRLLLDFSRQTASLNGKPLPLSSMEFKMLNLFCNNAKQVLTRSQLLEKLWDANGRFVDEHTLTTSISRLRSKIEPDGGAPYIKNHLRHGLPVDSRGEEMKQNSLSVRWLFG